jgi:uncharacterized RDD family membrane protein YckC
MVSGPRRPARVRWPTSSPRSWSAPPRCWPIGWLLAFGWIIYNRSYLGGTTGQSISNKVLNIRLVSDETGQPIGMLMAFVRDICHLVDSIICYVGYLFPLWDAKRQTLADKIVKTVVIHG